MPTIFLRDDKNLTLFRQLFPTVSIRGLPEFHKPSGKGIVICQNLLEHAEHHGKKNITSSKIARQGV